MGDTITVRQLTQDAAGWAEGSGDLDGSTGVLRLAGEPGVSYADTVLDTGPVGYWRLGDSGTVAADATGNGHDGEYVGSPAHVPGAIAGDADTGIHADGPTSYVRVPQANNPAPLGASPRTILLWVRNPIREDTRFLTYGVDSTGQKLHVRREVNDLRVEWSGGFVKQSVAWFPIDTWHFVGFTYDGTTVRLFFDGTEVIAGAATLNTAASDLFFGADFAATTSAPVTCDIDEPVIYDRVLSAAEVADLYSAGVNGSTSTLAPTGTWTSPPLDLSTLDEVSSSLVDWQATVPAGTTLAVETSTDSATWQPATDGGPIGGVTAGGTAQARVTLTSDGTTTPEVASLLLEANGTSGATEPARQRYTAGLDSPPWAADLDTPAITATLNPSTWKAAT